MMLSAPLLACCSNLVVGTVGLVLSLFMRPAVAGVLAWFASASWVGWLTPLYVVLPSYDVFNGGFTGNAPSLADVLLAGAYAADVIVILALVAMYRFRRMELV